MTQPALSLALAFACSTLDATAQTLVDWDFSGLVNPQVNNGPTVNPLIPAGSATLAPGLTTTSLLAARGAPSFDGLLWANANVAPGEMNHKYWDGDQSDLAGTANDQVSDNWIEFTLTNAGTAEVEVGRLSVSAWRNGTGAAGRYAFEVIADGGLAQPFGAPQDDLDTGDFGYDWFHFDDAVSFQSSLAVRFRPVALPGGLGTGNLHIDGLRVEASGPPGDPPAGPNVLLIVADDLGAGALGCYGNAEVLTPNLDALAAEALVFDRAYCQYSVCAASRASFGTGLYPARIQALGGGFENFDAAIGSHRTLYEHFRLSGFTTARVSKLYHMRIPGDITAGVSGPDHAPSWDLTFNVQAPEWMTPGPANHYTNETLNFNPNQHYGLGFGAAFYTIEGTTDGSEQADAVAAEVAVQMLGNLADEPFFLAVGFVRPHVPLVAPDSVYALYDAQQMTLADSVPGDLNDIPAQGVYWDEPVRGPFDDASRREVLRAYYASVTFMDMQVGIVLDRLQELGLEDDTIVIFTSDHGYHLGEHTMWQKLSLHEESARVPLIVRAPGGAIGRSDSLAELVDLYPTLTQLCGLETPAPCQGISLAPVLADPDVDVREASLSSVSVGHLVRTSDWAYMRYSGGDEELYDMAPEPLGDPLQFTNLAGDASFAAIVQELSDVLDARLLAAAGDAGQAYCFGDGTGAACPCNASGGAGEGCLNSTGAGATLVGGGLPDVASDGFRLTASGAPPGQPGILFHGFNAIANPFGSGILCVSPVVRHGVRFLDLDGSTTYSALGSLAQPGTTHRYQYWFRDPAGTCAGNFNFTNGWAVLWH